MGERAATVLARRQPFAGRIFNVTIDRVRLPHGAELELEVVRHRASVVLLPMPDPEHVILVRQYRYPVDRAMWELPAGTLEPGEAPEAAARRECHEEIGLVPGRIVRLGGFFPTPGYCDEEMIYFQLTDLATPDTIAAHDEDEHLEPRVFALSEARIMLRETRIPDMKTALGLLLI